MKFNPIRERQVSGRVNADMNRLRRVLETPEGNKGTFSEGGSLNPSAISRTYMSARRGSENSDRYRVNFSSPKEDVAVSITLDISASMSSGAKMKGSAQERALTKMFERPSAQSEVGYSASALMKAFHKAGIKSRLACVEPGSNREPNEIIPPRSRVVSSFEDPWTDEMTTQIVGLDPYTGTSLTDYAWCAIDPLIARKERHRIAIFMTDMADRSSALKLKDLALWSLSQGIVLAGSGMDGSDSSRLKQEYMQYLPNALYCTDAEGFSSQIVPFLIKAIRARQNGHF